MRFYKPFLIALLFTLSASKLLASHFYGADLFYTHVSGNTYRVTLVAFGDCGGGGAFAAFPTTRPRIRIKKGGVEIFTDFLEIEQPKEGIEVTPVCPALLDSTNCVNLVGTVPGVKKFVFSKEVTLSGPATDWRFVYLGESDVSTIAGRSQSLTNVIPGVVSMEATLDNTKYSNSSPEYTTIATPFYCVNLPTNFNPGAVDADGDSLVYELVTAMDGLNTITYKPGFNGSNPLEVAPGAFSFSSATGQLSFTPSNVQRSLTVYKVSEYRNGVLIGTSMREMTVVVRSCDNNPPVGYVSNASGATIVDSVTVKTCKGKRDMAFNINPTDADGHIINMVAHGLPNGVQLNITGNNTTRPEARFVWNKPELPEGNYTFYVTYTDEGCPIASKQTIAYTIRVAGDCNSFDNDNDDNNNNNPDDTVHYTVDETIGVPKAFTPNGDRKNDVLLIRGGKDVQDIRFSIYNRWGQIVFETKDINTGWDGTYNGADALVGAYAYVLSGVFKGGKTFQKAGNVTLLR